MNFLAHCALAQDASVAWQTDQNYLAGLLAGAVIGDFIKGPVPNQVDGWPTALSAGVRLHRRIDALSNRDPHIRQSCERFPKSLRRLAPVYVDILADHALSVRWRDHYESDIQAFTRQCHEALQDHGDYLPERGQRFVSYMIETDLLANYHEWRTISRGLYSVTKRLRRLELWPEIDHICQNLKGGLLEDFDAYYPSLRAAWLNWRPSAEQ